MQSLTISQKNNQLYDLHVVVHRLPFRYLKCRIQRSSWGQSVEWSEGVPAEEEFEFQSPDNSLRAKKPQAVKTLELAISWHSHVNSRIALVLSHALLTPPAAPNWTWGVEIIHLWAKGLLFPPPHITVGNNAPLPPWPWLSAVSVGMRVRKGEMK